jgi:pyrroloquinoline quinone biosynthesis protein B
MRVKILGSAAGGGFPQWNCACANCRAARSGTFAGKSRTQAQVAVSADSRTWFLLGASPDLRGQIVATPELHPDGSRPTEKETGPSLSIAPSAAPSLAPSVTPDLAWEVTRDRIRKIEAKALRNLHRSRSPELRPKLKSTEKRQPDLDRNRDSVRQSPIAGAVLASADIDHVLGLLLLRELQPLRVYATDSIRRILTEDNSMFAMLQRVPGQVTWSTFTPGTIFALENPAGEDSGLRCRALSLGTHYPAYVSPRRQNELTFGEASLGLIVETPGGKRLAYMPAVPQIDDALLREFDSADVLLFDGTFWSGDELIRMQGGGQTAQQMGHVPVSSAEGSLNKLAGLRRPRKIFIHINNTNPMLNEASPEYRQVRESGWEVAEDGCQFDL